MAQPWPTGNALRYCDIKEGMDKLALMSNLRSIRPVVPKIPFFAADAVLVLLGLLVFAGEWPNPGPKATAFLIASVVSGSLLLALPYFLEYRALRLIARLEANQVGTSVHAALREAEGIVERLEEIERRRSATSLITEKLPELIETRLDNFVSQSLKVSEAAGERMVREAGNNLAQTLFSMLRPELSSQFSNLGRALADQFPDPKKLETTLGVLEASARAHSNGGLPAIPRVAPHPPRSEEDAETRTAPPPPQRPLPRATGKPKTSSLVVTAFVGIDNRLYIRGTAAGLSPDSGTPLDLAGIGEWRWQTEISQPVEIEIWLNDKVRAMNSPVVLDPGATTAYTPEFPRNDSGA